MPRHLILIISLLLLGVLPNPSLAEAQGGPDAWVNNGLNLRTGPGTTFEIIVVLPAETGLMLEARNEDSSWLLVHTEDSIFRGWIAGGGYVRYRDGFDPAQLPVSSEIIRVLLAPGNAAPPMAVVSSWARDTLYVYQGPGKQYPILHTLPPTTGLVLEGRSLDGMWVLAHTSGGGMRGWVSGTQLYFREDINQALLPILSEIMPGPGIALTPIPTAAPTGPAALSGQAPPAAAASGNTQVSYSGSKRSYSPARVANIDLWAYPVVPSSVGQARAIYLQGQSRGANRIVVAKVGDCASWQDHFLKPFGGGGYTLGEYGYLQNVISHFSESFTYSSVASSPGFVAGAVLDPTWSDPGQCQPGESPLQCEYRLRRPAVAVIMFGTQDVFLMTPEQFDGYLRRIVKETIQAGIIPVLSTFPTHLAYWDNSILFNKIVVLTALDYNIPLINLWLALEGLPNHGLDPDGNHLSNPMTSGGDLTQPNLQTGYAMRNLVTLQALDVILRSAMY